MNLMRRIRTFQFTTRGIRICGIMLLLMGAWGAMLQCSLTGAGNMTNSQLLDAMESDPSIMASMTYSLGLQMLGTCALPIFSMLLVEGATHTGNYGKYFLRVLGLAVVCQFPYNLLMNRNALLMTQLNPVFAMVMCMIMLYFFRRYPEKSAKNIALKIVAIIGVYLWSNILGVEHGAASVILTAVLWGLRGKSNLQTFVGIMVLFACSIISMYYIAAPIAFLILHFYEGEQGDENRLINYLAYPVILLAFGILGLVG